MILMLGACAGSDTPLPVPEPAEPELVVMEAPVGPADPLIVGAPTYPVEPVVHDATGGQVALAEFRWGWRPVGEWAPGHYEVVGAVGVDLSTAIPFDVARWGVDPIDPLTLVGRAWEVTDYRSALAMYLPFVVDVDALGAMIVVEDVAGDQALFSLVGRLDDTECLVLRDFATLTENGGGIDWAVDELSFDAPIDGEVVEIESHQLGLSVRWLAAADRAWATGAATLDTRKLGPLVDRDEDGICGMLGALGSPCDPCPDGAPLCLAAELHAAVMDEVPAPALDTLPACGFDLVGLGADTDPDTDTSTGTVGGGGGGSGTPPIGCELDPLDLPPCSCQTYGVRAWMPLLFAGMIAGSRRRRR